MKPLLAGLALALALSGCSAVDGALISLSPKAGAVAVTLTDTAKQACAHQAFFNEVAGSAALFGPKVAMGAAAASAAVGVGCVWANS
jgi:hypothetical protein